MKDTTFERAILALDQGKLWHFLCETIGMYREFVDVHGHDPDVAVTDAVLEMIDGTRAIVELDDAGEL